jgi:hypothetical protein
VAPNGKLSEANLLSLAGSLFEFPAILMIKGDLS